MTTPAPAAGRVLALCADDFGQARGISAGIARLAHAQRLSAVACITNGPHWEDSVALLEGLPDTVDVGLHLNFTEGRPLSARLGRRWRRLPSLSRLIVQAHLRLLPLSQVRNEVHAQLAAFNQALGRPPAFIDGHQHVHHLPGLRQIILDMVEHVQPIPAVRNTGRVLGPGAGFERWMIEATGGRALAAELGERVIPHNPAVLGVCDFMEPNYQSLMRGWLAELPAEGGLLFCHPGTHLDGDPPDAIAAARERELAYLGSVAFDADLAAANVRLGRVWRT
ncbi:MAG: ChbG/HpnK family deacetylase [Rhizobiales bacterium]|nr:ChbG/HpnK family deacetylase [Rhizobacter sp.]